MQRARRAQKAIAYQKALELTGAGAGPSIQVAFPVTAPAAGACLHLAGTKATGCTVIHRARRLPFSTRPHCPEASRVGFSGRDRKGDRHHTQGRPQRSVPRHLPGGWGQAVGCGCWCRCREGVQLLACLVRVCQFGAAHITPPPYMQAAAARPAWPRGRPTRPARLRAQPSSGLLTARHC